MPKRILVVDDEPDIVFILGLLLRQEGYQVETAADGIEAVEAAQTSPFDLVLMDAMMPEMNGYQACRVLKNFPITRDVPVIMLTAKVRQSDRFWGIDSGADAFVTKPYDEIELLAKIREFLPA